MSAPAIAETPVAGDRVAAIELCELTKHYRATVAVDRLSLTVRRGVTLGLLGPNGAGKSTTIKMLLGMTAIEGGRAIVLGHDVARTRTAFKTQVGYVPESHQIYRWMRVGEVIHFVKSFYPTWNEDICGALLAQFELPWGRKVRYLSKGMLTKLALVVAVAHEPELLVLDEPFSGIDPIAREEILDGMMTAVCRGRTTVLFSSHTLDDVTRLADEIAIVFRGQLLAHKPLAELLHSVKRVKVSLRKAELPKTCPTGTIWHSIDRQYWELTLLKATPATYAEIERLGGGPIVEERPLESLADIFKDYIRGARKRA